MSAVSSRRDAIIVGALNAGNILVNFATGHVFGTRGPGGLALARPVRLRGTPIKGYTCSTIHHEGQRSQVLQHRVVWIAAHGVPPEGLIVAHEDDIKTNNWLANLYLATPAQNSADAARTGCYLSGDASPATRLPVALREKVVEHHTQSGSVRATARHFGISKSRVHQLVAAPLAATALALTLTGCEDPCKDMKTTAPPEAAELMEQGYEVSKDVGDSECELQPDGKWTVDA